MTTTWSPTTSQSQVYTEVENKTDASESDIEEFAKRIGIDVTNERHLLPLAKEGLMQKLPPDWKPHREPIRNVWYYYNSETHKSQWEHPLDAIYREKVRQARTDNAMNRIQTFDHSSPKLLSNRNLPPLKPLNSGSNGLKPLDLGPLTPPASSGNLNPLFNEPIGGRRNQLEPLTIPPTKRTGLTVTGGGSSFLKSAAQKLEIPAEKESASDSDGSEKLMRRNMINPSAVPLGFGLGSPGQSPLKGILANSMSRTSTATGGKIASSSNSLRPWDLDPSSFTGEENNLWSSLQTSKENSQQRSKGNVKFKIEDPELNFKISSSEKNSETESGRSSTSQSNTNTDAEEAEAEAEEISKSLSLRKEKLEREYKPVVPTNSVMNLIEGNKKSTIPAEKPILLPEPIASSTPKSFRPGPASQLGAGEKRSDRDLNLVDKATKDEMLTNLESQLKDYQKELEAEKAEREVQMKKHMEQTLESTKQEYDDEIRKLKTNFDQKLHEEFEKERLKMEDSLNMEINKMRNDNQEKIRIEKEKQAKMLKNLEDEMKTIDIKARREEEIAKMEAELQEELKVSKEKLREDHKSQMKHLRDYLETITEKLKSEFKDEEETLRNQHATLLAEISAEQKKKTEEILESYKTEQESQLKELKEKYERQKATATEIQPNDSMSSSGIGSTVKPKFQGNSKKELESMERELKVVKSQYAQLEEKYRTLKQGLQHTITAERERSEKLNKGKDIVVMSSFAEQGDVSSSQSEGKGTSLDISGSTLKKNNHRKPKQQKNNVFPSDSEDKLNKALAALETLREQILEIKSEQEVRANSPEEKKYTNGYSSVRRNSDTIYPKNRMSTASATKNRNVPIEGETNSDQEQESCNSVVQEAKDFIKSQKRRLNRIVPSASARFSSIRPVDDGLHEHRMANVSLRPTKNDHLHSETESSGVGSLKSSSRAKKAQVSQDIDTILQSLQKLDKQMKYLWTVVGPDKVNATYDISTSAASVVPNRLIELNHDYPQPQQPNNNFLSTTTAATNSRYSLGPSYFNAANENLWKNLSHTHFKLDEHVNNLRNTQARVSQILPSDEMSESLREKTKDLREWLDKF